MRERIRSIRHFASTFSLAEVPLYYTGLSDTATITFEGDRSTSKLVKLDRMFNVYLNICECFYETGLVLSCCYEQAMANRTSQAILKILI